MAEETKLTSGSIKDIKKLIKSDKFVIGADVVVKGMKASTIEKVYLASNCQQKIREMITYYAPLCKTEVLALDVSNDELGIICKKPFSISVLGVRK